MQTVKWKGHLTWILLNSIHASMLSEWLERLKRAENDIQMWNDSNWTDIFQKSKADICTFHIFLASVPARSQHMKRKLMLGGTAAFGPQGSTLILPGWMTFLICCIATSLVSCLFFLGIFSVKCLQWDVIRLRKGGLKHLLHAFCSHICISSSNLAYVTLRAMM